MKSAVTATAEATPRRIRPRTTMRLPLSHRWDRLIGEKLNERKPEETHEWQRRPARSRTRTRQRLR